MAVEYKWRSGDFQVYSNLLSKFRERLIDHTPREVAYAWENFSLSADFPDEEKFPNYLPTPAGSVQ